MSTYSSFDLYNPTDEHRLLRRTIREFVRAEVEPQALAHDREPLRACASASLATEWRSMAERAVLLRLHAEVRADLDTATRLLAKLDRHAPGIATGGTVLHGYVAVTLH